jgi:hypothetical protein
VSLDDTDDDPFELDRPDDDLIVAVGQLAGVGRRVGGLPPRMDGRIDEDRRECRGVGRVRGTEMDLAPVERDAGATDRR